MRRTSLIPDICDEIADEGKAIIQASLLIALGRFSDGKEVLEAAIEKLQFLVKKLP